MFPVCYSIKFRSYCAEKRYKSFGNRSAGRVHQWAKNGDVNPRWNRN
jgi:hypothetical protein